MNPTVEARGVSKWFGQKVAVSDLTVAFGPGVTGLLGPNGAGKTTLLRMLTGLQRPSQGDIRVLGVDPRHDTSVYRTMAMVPEDEHVYPGLTLRGFVELSAGLSSLPDPARAAERAIEAVQLTDVAERRIGGFSKGMRQRAKVAAALVADPQILVLDEPLNGADPIQRARLIRLFVDLGHAGRTVIVSSHVLAEVERMAGRVVAMVDGRLAAEGDVASLRSAMTDKPRLIRIVTDRPRELGSALMSGNGVSGVRLTGTDSLEIQATDPMVVADGIARSAQAAEARITRLEPADESLESVFRYLVGRR